MSTDKYNESGSETSSSVDVTSNILDAKEKSKKTELKIKEEISDNEETTENTFEQLCNEEDTWISRKNKKYNNELDKTLQKLKTEIKIFDNNIKRRGKQLERNPPEFDAEQKAEDLVNKREQQDKFFDDEKKRMSLLSKRSIVIPEVINAKRITKDSSKYRSRRRRSNLPRKRHSTTIHIKDLNDSEIDSLIDDDDYNSNDVCDTQKEYDRVTMQYYADNNKDCYKLFNPTTKNMLNVNIIKFRNGKHYINLGKVMCCINKLKNCEYIIQENNNIKIELKDKTEITINNCDMDIFETLFTELDKYHVAFRRNIRS